MTRRKWSLLGTLVLVAGWGAYGTRSYFWGMSRSCDEKIVEVFEEFRGKAVDFATLPEGEYRMVASLSETDGLGRFAIVADFKNHYIFVSDPPPIRKAGDWFALYYDPSGYYTMPVTKPQ